MTYETLLSISQLASLIIFGSMMTAILIHVFRPKNKAHFDAAARMALDDEFDTRLDRDDTARLRRDDTARLRRDNTGEMRHGR